MSVSTEIQLTNNDSIISCWGDKNTAAEKSVHDVDMVNRLIGYIAIALFLFLFGSALVDMIPHVTGWIDMFFIGISAFLCLVGTGIVVLLLETFILKPVRAIKYAKALSAIESSIPTVQPHQGKQTHWKYPFPGAMTLNSLQNTLSVQSINTDYRLLTLQQHHIVGAKVERKQTIHTETKQSGSTVFMFTRSIGYATGRRSKSKTRVEEEAFLEIAYDSGDKMPRIISVPFGSNRRAAEEWVLAIQRVCTA